MEGTTGDTDPNPATKDLTKILAEERRERTNRIEMLQDIVSCQSTALDKLTEHVTIMTATLKKDDGKTKEEQEQYEIACRRRIPPPIFKGNPGERPEAHILRAKDWMEAIGITKDLDKRQNFKLTLDHLAREWFNDTGTKYGTWEILTREFSKYFSTQGKSMRNLHRTWKNFEFNPETDDIEEFVRNVQECAHQLGYDDLSITNMIKSCMPMSTYSSLYGKEDLPSVIAMVKDFYAKGPQAPKPDGGTTATPFSQIKTGPLDNTLNRLSEALYKLDIKPFKPYIAPRGRGRGCGRGHGQGQGQAPGRQYNFQSSGKVTFTRGATRPRGRGRVRGGKFDKSPNQRKPRVASKSKDMDREHCRFYKQLGHWEKDCPEQKKAGDTVKPTKSGPREIVTTMEKMRGWEPMEKSTNGWRKSALRIPSTPWMISPFPVKEEAKKQ